MATNSALLDALRYLAIEHPDLLTPADHEACRTPDWSYYQARDIHQRLTTTYAAALIDAGWEPDFLPAPVPDPVPGQQDLFSMLSDPEPTPNAPTDPAPPTTPEPSLHAPHNLEPAILALDEGYAVLTSPEGHPIRTDGKTLPAARWDGHTGWRIPITPRTAPAIMDFVRAHMPITVTPEARDAIKAAASATPDPNISLSGSHFHIRVEYIPEIQDDIKRAGGKWTGDVWQIPATNAHLVLRLAKKHALLFTPDAEIKAASTGSTFEYDHTLDGLRGVPISDLTRLSATQTEQLAAFGVTTVYDLLTLVPLRYLDRRALAPIRDLPVGQNAGVIAKVTQVSPYDRAKRLGRVTIADDSGSLSVTFFNSPWQTRRFRVGDKVAAYGKVDVWEGRNGKRVLQMTNPVMDPLEDDTTMVVPVYPQSQKSRVTTWDLNTAATEAIGRLGDLSDPLPDDLRTRLGFMPRVDAIKNIHFPGSLDDAQAARTRLAFDELFRMQLILAMQKYASEDNDHGVTHTITGSITGPFIENLPFPLTGAQQRALTEIKADLERPYPMHRLLQGDVGSGKSIMALLTLLSAVEGGHQGALMAPTEILAWQLYKETVERTEGLTTPDGDPIRVGFLANKTKVKERRAILAGLADGTVHIVVGTHALLVPEVAFKSLGVVVIDEQHRFGVEQRAALRAKAVHATTGEPLLPDTLIMTATPIPRTASLTTFGDLDLTILDELPPGRTPIVTQWIRHEPDLSSPLESPWNEVRAQVEAGRQAYVVCPLVEESEKLAAASATETYEALMWGALDGLRVGLVHGQQPQAERDETMLAFKAGELDVIVATTVIEVGVNVPNATIMVILDAPRFGLAQLHQLRGRVGRGQYASYCYLVGEPKSADGVERMKVMEATTDGFVIAEKDLELRGTGSIFGTAQAGDSDLRVADLRADKDLVLLARNEAVALLDNDHALLRRSALRNEVLAALPDEQAAWLRKA